MLNTGSRLVNKCTNDSLFSFDFRCVFGFYCLIYCNDWGDVNVTMVWLDIGEIIR